MGASSYVSILKISGLDMEEFWDGGFICVQREGQSMSRHYLIHC